MSTTNGSGPQTAAAVVRSELPGTVLTVAVAPGDRVDAGDEVCLLESMKMEIPVLAPAAGTVTRVLVRPGDAVATGAVVVQL
ncbi:biotin/lipoyl-binding carrier protein [Pseudonocardia nematodicida]|uniref:Biotin/lipoyl-binding carrier protein n=1 Tax=Pseudonocardia nematodicida TaxID=1206997 RepID=A0ABV1K6Q7_9PSEU